MSSEGNRTVIESFSADDTHALGVTLGQQAKPGDVCTLVGDLGVGKTVLTQGIAEGLGITEPIRSPVNDPGPAETAIKSIVLRSSSVILATSSSIGRSVCECVFL